MTIGKNDIGKAMLIVRVNKIHTGPKALYRPVVVKKVVAFFYKFLSSLISKKIVLWLTSFVESSSTSQPAHSSLVPPGP
jgi:hypothetical protein